MTEKNGLEEFRNKKDGEEQREGQETQLNFWQRYWKWMLIGGGIVLIIALSLIRVSPSDGGPKLTLASLNQTVAALNASYESRVSKLESRTVWHTNQISELEDVTANMTASLSTIPYWSGMIDTLNSRMTAEENASADLQNQLNSMAHNSTAYVTITGMSPPNINAEICGSGNFSVILTLYGSGMLNSTVFNFYSGNYTVGGTYVGNNTMAICLDSRWQDGDEIKLAVTGCVVDYASAAIGGS